MARACADMCCAVTPLRNLPPVLSQLLQVHVISKVPVLPPAAVRAITRVQLVKGVAALPPGMRSLRKSALWDV
jgi:hypothetical protein